MSGRSQHRRGAGAVIGRHIRVLRTDGKEPILVRSSDRICIYVTRVTPIGPAKN